ncbi:MAG TPA: hypothetical protein VHM28_10870 [Anaerolineales bacterium]|jgi:hypothetical protein|nr:hypothetical protein [Anaerolineales bacterium]
MKLTQSQPLDNQEDTWVSQWLTVHRFTFKYQYPVGEYLIDFFIYTQPLATMLKLDRIHWHAGELDETERREQIDAEDAIRDIAKTPITVVYAADLADRDTLEAALTRELLHG